MFHFQDLLARRKRRGSRPTCLLDFAIPAALWMGFEELVLLGADYSLDNYRWFYNSEDEKRPKSPDNFRTQEMLMAHRKFSKLKNYLTTYRPEVKIINCSPLSDLDMFEKRQLADVLYAIAANLSALHSNKPII